MVESTIAASYLVEEAGRHRIGRLWERAPESLRK